MAIPNTKQINNVLHVYLGLQDDQFCDGCELLVSTYCGIGHECAVFNNTYGWVRDDGLILDCESYNAVKDPSRYTFRYLRPEGYKRSCV